MANEQRTFEEQKTRLTSEFMNEKHRIFAEIKDKEHEFEKRKEELIFDKNDVVHHLKKEFKERIIMLENKNQVIIKQKK